MPVAQAEDKKPEAKNPPKLLVVSPIGVPVGAPTQVTLRGLRLDQIIEVYAAETRQPLKILKKEKVAVPGQQDANRVGDTQAVVEVNVPGELAGRALSLIAVGADGSSGLRHLLIDPIHAIASRKEPHQGFHQAQAVEAPCMIDGVLSNAPQVDVYRVDAKAGQQLAIEVLAARHGSALDPILSLYDAAGYLIATCDDLPDSADARLAVSVPHDGAYYITVQDAQDQGGPAHVYRLVIK